MTLIYKPKGKAQEYAELALNIYKGCQHGCRYCYNTKTPWTDREKYYLDADPKKDFLKRLEIDAKKIALEYGAACPEILLSFVGDVYQPADEAFNLARPTIEILIDHGLPFTILSKGGMRATKDFDILKHYKKFRAGTSLVFWDQEKASRLEPGAAAIKDRVDSILKAHELGIKTWISIEPVIYQGDAIKILENLGTLVDQVKVGKINHYKKYDFYKPADWRSWRDQKLIPFLSRLKTEYYIKDSLRGLK